MTHLLLTVRFLDDRYHGLLDRNGTREWPPSPFRLFQALVAGVARRGELVHGEDVPTNKNYTPTGRALDWLQRYTAEHPPIIIAPKAQAGQKIVRFVPNNDGDKKIDRQERLTAKPTIPTLFLLESDQKPEVHYAWSLEEDTVCPIADLQRAARSLTTLGWGIDMAFADARLINEAALQALQGIRWSPKKYAGSPRDALRVPTFDPDLGECSLCDLRHCHSTFINRISDGKPLRTVDKPKVYDRVLYTSVERPTGPAYRLFELRNLDGSRASFPHRRFIYVAGMVRHLAIEAMQRHPPPGVFADWVERYVAGHAAKDDPDHRQLSFVPLPSVGHPHTDPAVRRVMIVAPLGDEAWLDHLARRLAGQALRPEPGKPDPFRGEPPLLVPLRRAGDTVTRRYTAPSRTWHSITPVILPGHDDHKPAKTRKLIEKALAQSGVDQRCEFEWSAFSRFPKAYSAHKYDQDKRPAGYARPDHLRDQTAVHLTIRFGRRQDPNVPNRDWIPAEHPVPGPIVLGSGRHCGFGLMVNEPDGDHGS